MRIARKFSLLAGMALATMALAAPHASAAEGPIEIYNEATAEHCNLTNCQMQFVGRIVILVHFFGIENATSDCDASNFNVEIGEDGYVNFHQQTMVAIPPRTCTHQACDSASEAEWLTSAVQEEVSASQTQGTARFCFEPVGGGTEVHCLIQITLNHLPLLHRTTMLLDHVENECGNGEVIGNLTEHISTSLDSIEVVHLL